MKRHLMVGALLVGVFSFAGALTTQFIGWWTVPIGAGAIAAVWLAARCWHQDISLLPPVPGGGADREYARWYCQRCGATWAAALQSATRPRPLYLGFDQVKAEQAAARADTLERERRRLAIERAGLAGKSLPGETNPRPIAATVVAAVESGTLTRTARVRRLSSVDAGPNLDESRIAAHRRASDDLPRVRPLRG